MNIEAYIVALTSSAARLPALLAGWHDLDADLRAHYSDALVELLCEKATAESLATASLGRRLSDAISVYRRCVVEHASTISELMGIDVLELLAPPSVTGAGSMDAPHLLEVEDTADLALAA